MNLVQVFHSTNLSVLFPHIIRSELILQLGKELKYDSLRNCKKTIRNFGIFNFVVANAEKQKCESYVKIGKQTRKKWNFEFHRKNYSELSFQL